MKELRDFENLGVLGFTENMSLRQPHLANHTEWLGQYWRFSKTYHPHLFPESLA